MPKVIGTNKSFKPQFIVTEDEFKKIKLKINGQKVEGRNVYGFFLTEEEFKLISSSVCFDGWCTNPILEYKEGEAMDLRMEFSESSSAEYVVKSKENEQYLREIEGGKFVTGGYLWMKDKLQELNIPVREIKIWHMLGWPFKA